MGFSSALQGRSAHDALLGRQDAEIRLIETMKRCLLQKVKTDKEYAVGLASVALQGLKSDRGDDFQGSQIMKAWRSVMEEWEHTAKQIKANAEILESVCQDKLAQLYQDKRKARKAYQEEHNKIATQFTNISDEVTRKKCEYQKHLDYYKLLRSRFEEHYIKSGRGGRKLDDVRDKYQKACRKLHLAHNEYVLLINEAVEVEKDYRTILLPGLLEHQQSLQEGFITIWKNILQDASQHCDFTSNNFTDIRKRVENHLQNVNPAEEYREFTEKHKTSPASPVVFQFDQSLLEDKETFGKLQPNSLTLDNLTVDWLRAKLTDLENSIKDCQEKQSKLQMENGTPNTTQLINGIGNRKESLNINGTFIPSRNAKDFNQLRCQEKQMLKLADLIKAALNEVGCEELPSGCDDLSVDQSFIENNISNGEQPSSLGASYILQKGAEVISMIRAPFKRKTTPTSSPRDTPKTDRATSITRSLGSSSVNSLDLNECDSNVYAEIDVNTALSTNTNNTIAIVDSADTDTNNEIESTVFDSIPSLNLLDLTEMNSSHANLFNVDDDQNRIDMTLFEENVTKSDDIAGNIASNEIQTEVGVDDDHDVVERRQHDAIEFIEDGGYKILKKSTLPYANQEIADHLKIETTSNLYDIDVNAAARLRGAIKKTENIGNNSDIRRPAQAFGFAAKSVNTIFTSIKEKMKKPAAHPFDMVDTSQKVSADASPTSWTTTGDAIQTESSTVSMNDKVNGSKRKSRFKPKLKFGFKLAASKKPKMCRRCLKLRNSTPSKKSTNRAKETSANDSLDNAYCTCAVDFSDDGSRGNDHYSELISMTLATNRPLYEEEWFHGVLPREEVVRLLKSEGDFLVRETIRNEESQIVLSVCWNGHKHFIVQTTADGLFRFEGPAFPSIQELILHQNLSELPVTSRSGAILKKPVLRERWELSNDDVILLDKIGRGNFGDVYKSRLKSSKVEVAVKTCRMTLPDEQKRKFLQEGRILKQYDHPNIVKLIGICVQKQPIMIVMELVPGGSLLNYLRKNAATLNIKQLISMCKDAAAGMRYLESKNCIHRDLAARNCLIGYENIVKISDFGMSREEEEYIVSDGMKQIPIKWTAPEALNFGKYTSLCDVWSYGILIWEIFSKGDTPYSGMSNSRARERIDAGYRMPAPENASPELYRLMLRCWAYEPETRPHFDEIYNIVDALLGRE